LNKNKYIERGIPFIAGKINRTVVRNAGYRIGEFGIRERHNERKNESYRNGDIDPARADMNIHFRRNFAPDGTPETYEHTFNRLMEERVIVQKGQKKDGSAIVFDELIYDVNTAYFEENGGYEYAVKFFEEAYRCAVNEVGGEQYILSAILHADERNKALSEEMGRNIYHYHLHVSYVPIVEKKVYFKKNNKDPNLAGKLKEVIPQISHWKKWPQRIFVERDGKTIQLNSYSLLQDRFYEHMKAAGFEGFERGDRGSTAGHLSDLEYKTMMESERLAAKSEQLAAADNELTAANEKISTAKGQLTDIRRNLKALRGKVLTTEQIEQIPVKPAFGIKDNVVIPRHDWQNVKKTALTQATTNDEYKSAIEENAALKKQKAKLRKDKQGLEERVTELEDGAKEKFLERAMRDAELHNLNAVGTVLRPARLGSGCCVSRRWVHRAEHG